MTYTVPPSGPLLVVVTVQLLGWPDVAGVPVESDGNEPVIDEPEAALPPPPSACLFGPQ
jgi:hypothetical protein